MDIIYLMKREMLRRKYSPRTIITYTYCLNTFMKYCLKEPRKWGKEDVKEFLYRMAEKNMSGSTLNVYLQAVKFAMEEILNKRFFVNLCYARLPKHLPEVLTKEEIKMLFGAVENKKHLLLLKLMYGAGLRVGEIIKLKVKNLDFEGNYGWVREGKGRKDRLFIIPQCLKEELKGHIMENILSYEAWLFAGIKNTHLSIRTVQEVIRQAQRKAGILKRIHPHTLRHSFATHLIEDGYDVMAVQGLLGHNSARTTMVYVHTAAQKMIAVKSPLDVP